MGNDGDETIPRNDGLTAREPGEIVLRAEPVVAPAPQPEIRDLEYNRQARTKPEMFPYGVNWWRVAVIVLGFAWFMTFILNSPPPHRHGPKALMIRARVDMNALSLALESHRIDTGQFPSQPHGLQSLLNQIQNTPGWNGPYFKYLPPDPWQTPYQYLYPGVHNTGSYDLSSAGPDKKFGTADDVRNW